MTASTRRRLLVSAAGFIGAASALGRGAAQVASPWASSFRSRARLLGGGPEAAGGAPLAGVEIVLEPGFRTYWRSPGEAGLAPSLDWSGSANLERAEVLWPAPTRFEEAGSVSYGYRDVVILPVRILPGDPSRPVRLDLKLLYGACRDICIPAEVALSLDLPAQVPVGPHPSIREALARVPQPQPLGAEEALSVLRLDPAAEGRGLVVTVRAPAGPPAPQLFVEGPEGWFLLPAGAPVPAGPGLQAFPIEVLERPRQIARFVDLTLTLTAGGRAVETRASLDSAALPG